MSDRLTVTEDSARQLPTLVVAGELDPESAPLLRSGIDAMIALGVTDLVIDVSGLTFMDSSGLKEIVRARNELSSVVLRSPGMMVRRLLEVTGLADFIEIAD